MWALSLLVFKDVGFKFEEHVCNKCHDLLTMAYSLKDIVILSTKWVILDVFWWVLVKMKVLEDEIIHWYMIEEY